MTQHTIVQGATTTETLGSSTDNPRLRAALDYAGRGWPVLALMPGEKVPDGTLCPHGFKDATLDLSTPTITVR
jgi:hypothetical protein